MSKPITAWLSIGSTYSYLTALRINGIQRDMGLNLSVKPISIRAIMKSMDNIPFPPSKKTKVDYMWRDIERRADWYGLPKPKLPALIHCKLSTKQTRLASYWTNKVDIWSILRRPTVFGLYRAWRLAQRKIYG